MLSEFYNQEITVKYDRSGTPYDGYTYKTKTIKGAIQYKQKKVINQNGDEVVSSSQLFTNELLNVEDIVNYFGRDEKIILIQPIIDHFGTGQIDHYEVMF